MGIMERLGFVKVTEYEEVLERNRQLIEKIESLENEVLELKTQNKGARAEILQATGRDKPGNITATRGKIHIINPAPNLIPFKSQPECSFKTVKISCLYC